MTSSAEDSDTDSYKDSYLDPSYSYYGFTTSSSSDEEETCMENFNKEGKIRYTSRSGTRYLSPEEAYFTAMSTLQNNPSQRMKRSQQSAATSSDEDNSEEDEPNTRLLKPKKKLSSKKRAVKRPQTAESGSSKKKTISRRTPIQTATSESQRPSQQLSAALPIAEDNSEEDEPNARLLKPEKKISSKKRAVKRPQTAESGSSKKKTISRRTPIQTATSETQRPSQQLSAALPIAEGLLQHNADDMVPAEIKLLSDKKSVPLYLKLLESGSEKKKDIRLVIVGEKGAGKTSFLKRLFQEDIGEVTSTNGIEIHKVKCKAESDDGIWNKLKDTNEEAELHTRLLKPYEESLKNQVKENTEVSVKEAAVISSTDHKVIPKSIQTVSQSLDNLQSQKATVSQEKQSEHPLEQAHKDIESMLKSEVHLHDKEEYATLLLWDFAGDKEFYHTHQTFLSPDAIYLVITNLDRAHDKEAQGMFRLWMDSIHCYCRLEQQNNKINTNTVCSDQPFDPPVILLGTWKDLIRITEGEELQNACMERLDAYAENVSVDACRHIRDEYTHLISNTEDDNSVFQDIRRDILKLARTIRSWNKDYPLKFIQLEKCLHEKKRELPIISYQELLIFSRCTSNPLNSEELSLFLRFHHAIRALVYFEDLPDYIILDTQWLSDAFKCIVTAEKFQLKVRTFKNKEKWDDLNQRGILHSEVLEELFKKEHSMVSQHKDHILNVMEKFDIIIRPIISEEGVTNEILCYYVPCMVKEKPKCDVYEMFNVTKDTCKKSTWFCLKFSFLPPHLMHHLIASLCREYEVSKVFDTIQNKKIIALFRGSAVFDLQNTRLQKLLVTVCPNLIQIQVLEFNTNAVIERGSFSHIAGFVEGEIIKIISTRFKMTNVTFEKKWECGSVNPECVTGSNDFHEEQNAEYFCETCTATHKFFGEWSNKQLSASVEESNSETVDSNQTVLLAKLYFHPDALSALKLSKVQTRKNSSGVLSKEEFNFAKMGIIVLNILADVLFDLLKHDRGNVKPRSECDITYLYGEHRNLNKNIPSYSGSRRYPWGGTWHDIQNTDIATGDDIERIRLTRNEMQHSKTFKLDDTRYNDLCNIIGDLLERFDQRNNPSKLYTEQLQEILGRTLSDEEVNSIQSEMAIEIEIEHRMNIPP